MEKTKALIVDDEASAVTALTGMLTEFCAQDIEVVATASNEKEAIYPCKHCGAYSPLSSGVMVEGRFYCGLAHAKAEGEKVQ